jgi:mRNA-degrading endonuclease YafQ of YafQ-DinJ toxin-antitoxin module
MRIIYTTEFRRLFKKLPMDIKEEALKREKIFRVDPFNKKLKTHKLSGKLKGCWAFSVSYQKRIIFEFGTDGIIYFHSVGDHNIYK